MDKSGQVWTSLKLIYLEKLVVFRGEAVRLKGVVEPFEVVYVEESNALSSDNVFVLVQRLVIWQRQHELGQSFVVTLNSIITVGPSCIVLPFP